jgi:membrane protein implicated in regulation of membrane protease activity
MDMSEPTLWWLLTGAAVAVELLTGTFYLLMLAIGMASAAIGAHLGIGTTGQLVVAALVGGGAVVAWHFKKDADHSEKPAQANPNVNLDIGGLIQIDAWNPDGTANVQYRGANWTAIHRTGITPSIGQHRVAELIGNRLLVDKS